jgi:Cyclic nucleotide-binding domain
MVGAKPGFSRYSTSPTTGAAGLTPVAGAPAMANATLLDVIRGLSGSTTETVERGKTIFFPGDPAEKVYLLRRGAVRLSRVYESGEEITVALLRENSLFGVLSLLTGQRSDRFYHAVAFTRVEMVTAPATSVRKAIELDASVGLLMLQGLAPGELPARALPRFRCAHQRGDHHRPAPLPPGHRRGDRLHSRHDHAPAGGSTQCGAGADRPQKDHGV